MVWPFARKQSKEQKVFLDFAASLFDGLVKSDTTAGSVLRGDPSYAKSLLATTTSQLKELAASPEGRGLRMRAKWAEVTEHFSLAKFYSNLSDDERGFFARECLQSSRDLQDQHYRHATTTHAWEVILWQSIFTHGWDGDQHTLERMIELAKILDEQCTAQYSFLMESAKARCSGVQLDEARKDSAKTDMILKEGARRRLAGIPFDDETPAHE
jgi:hypothetical protein